MSVQFAPIGESPSGKDDGLKMRVLRCFPWCLAGVASEELPARRMFGAKKQNGGNHNWGIERFSPHP